jgi:phosphate transport system permease protein
MASQAHIKTAIRNRRIVDRIFTIVGLSCLLLGLIVLVLLIGSLAVDGLKRIDWQFLTSFTSRRPERAGIYAGWVGTLLIIFVTASSAIPLGVAAGVYLEEYARKNWFTAFLEINIANLAGVPSIIYGLLGLGLFLYQLKLGASVATAGLTLGILVLPIVIVATREALRAIPAYVREAATALGATKWQVIRHHLLPYSFGGIATGIIIAISRAIGETAPLVTVGAAAFIPFLPGPFIKDTAPYLTHEWLSSQYTVIPIQMYTWVSSPIKGFQANAAAAGLVLVVVTLLLNGVAIYFRYRIRKKIKW